MTSPNVLTIFFYFHTIQILMLWKIYRSFNSHIFLAPLACGIVIGITMCSLAGRSVSRRGISENFVRIHPFVSAESYYYLTASQLIYQIRNFAPKDKILVLVTGNSTLQGYGQNTDELWTKKLQQKLGPNFYVINFAAHGATSGEIGNTVFNVLASEFKNSILVFNLFQGSVIPVDGGQGPYRNFFWDAYYKGFIPNTDEVFTRNVQRLQFKQIQNFDLLEMHLLSVLDSITFSRDLWSYIGYHYFFSVWNPLTHEHPFTPRKDFADPHFDLPPTPARVAQWTKDLDYLLAQFKPGILRDGTFDGPVENWKVNDKIANESYKFFQPQELHARTLVTIVSENSFLLDHLPQKLKEVHDFKLEKTAEELKNLGYNAIFIGNGWQSDDFQSNLHFSPAGGNKVAKAVAESIQSMMSRH
jgi:hypothetical protein